MSEIRIVAELEFLPGGREALWPALERLVQKSRAEAGNLAYEACEDLANPNHLFIIEKWASEEAIEEHNQTQHFQEFGKLAKNWLARNSVTLLKQAL